MRTQRTPARRPGPWSRRVTFQPTVERLESRLAPSVDVLTYHNDLARTGQNLQETQLTPATVHPRTFGQLFTNVVDGQVYGQPLLKTNVAIPGRGTHDVVFVVTQHDSVYAFDANSNTGANATPLWKVSFINPAAGITTVPSPGDTNSGDIQPEVGITSTPTIDPTTGTLYTPSKTKEIRAGVAHFVQKLHALDIATGAEKFGGPVLIGDTVNDGTGPDQGFTDVTPITVPGVGNNSDANGIVHFNALRENERDGLSLSRGVLYLSFTSHGDTTPYHGWVLGYNPTTLQVVSIYNTTPNGAGGALWMGGGAPAIDADGNIYFSTSTGFFSAPFSGPKSLAEPGGGLGYAGDQPLSSGNGLGSVLGIKNSVAIKFDLFQNVSEGFNSTGIFSAGRSPTVRDPALPPTPTALIPDQSVDLGGTGIDLHSQHLMQATLSYNGTILTETIVDTVTRQSFTKSYTVDIPTLVGGSRAFVGFTAGTGGLTMTATVPSWTFNGPDHTGGFANNQLTANGFNTSFQGTTLQLTDGLSSEAGSFFTNNQVNITNFTTTFTFAMTSPGFGADGMTFTIQNNTPGTDFADSLVKIGSTPGAGRQLPVLDYFITYNAAQLSGIDSDFGSGGVLLLPDQPGPHAHELITSDKTGRVFLVNRDTGSMGGFDFHTDHIIQELPFSTVGVGWDQGTDRGLYATPAYFNDGTHQLVYFMAVRDVLKSFTLTDGLLSTTPFARTSASKLSPDVPSGEFGFSGATPSISANGTRDGIVWATDNHRNGTPNGVATGAAVLHAYDATTLRELYNSSRLGLADLPGGGVKFATPTVANGKVYVPSQNGVSVFGLFPDPETPPVAPSNLSLTVGSATLITLNWTNNATNARDVQIFRAQGDADDFRLVMQVNRNATTFADTGLLPSTHYFYKVVASNSEGDSGPSNTANATTLIAPSVLQVTATGPSVVKLSWTPTANLRYVVQRSTDAVNFTTVASLTPDTLKFTDTGLAPNVYFYRVQGIDLDGTTAFSNVISVGVGLQVTVDHSNDFSSSSDLTANGTASFANISGATGGLNATGGVLNDGFSTNQAGTFFTNARQNIQTFTTTFTWQPNAESGAGVVANGISFIIQGNSATALGSADAGLGYQGIPNSVAVTLRDVDTTLANITDSSTQLGQNGAFLPATNVDISAATGNAINFNNTSSALSGFSLDVYQATLTYNGTTLFETIKDLKTGATFSTSFTVNIPAIVGGNTAFVGFGGSDATDPNISFLTNEVFTWAFSTVPSATALPLAPSNLKVANVRPSDDPRTSDVQLTWTINAANQTGTSIERSTDGVNFTPIATVGANAMEFTDENRGAGTFFYRVRAFNANGNSGFSNVDSVRIGVPGQIVTVDHSTGFASHTDLTANGNTTFAGTALRLTDGGTGEAGSSFLSNRVGVKDFTSTFTFQMHDGSLPMADGMTFVIQGNSPTALGGNNGDLGYTGIGNSVAIKFGLADTLDVGPGNNSTGLFINGDAPNVPHAKGESSIDLHGTGIDLHSQHAFRVTLDYDGTRLTETITDTVTNATFTHTYIVNIAAIIGGNAGYVGFTAATNSQTTQANIRIANTTVADIQAWTYQTVLGRPLVPKHTGISPIGDVVPVSGNPSSPSPAASILATGGSVEAVPFIGSSLQDSPADKSLTVVPDNEPEAITPSAPARLSMDTDVPELVRPRPDLEPELVDQVFASAEVDALRGN